MSEGVEVSIRDCGPRDGLQGEAPLPAEDRARLAMVLADAGVPNVEACAFVSPKAVPAMAHAAQVWELLDERQTKWWALVPNHRGAELAIEAGVEYLTVTVSASPTYSRRNVGMEPAESLRQVEEIVSIAGDRAVDVVISCAFGSPYEIVAPSGVAKIVHAAVDAGAGEITLADTTGTCTPTRVEQVLGDTGIGVGLHLHDTRGTALLNAYRALQLGVRRFDTAVGGLGGSPFAAGSGGNLATEDLVLLLDSGGYKTGISLDGVLGSKPVSGRAGRAARAESSGSGGPNTASGMTDQRNG